MSYSEQELQRMVELHGLIEGTHTESYAAPNYKASPYLRELAGIILSQDGQDVETLENKICVLQYIADCYYSMGRPAVSAKYYTPLLQAHVALQQLRRYDKEEQDAFEDAFFLAVKCRNYYTPNDCEDLKRIVLPVLSDRKTEKLYQEGKTARNGMPKSDPVEQTEEYLAVIDEVEALIDRHKTMDFCMEYWSLKGQFLAQKGIHWQSPVILNPGVMFD